MSEKTAVIIGAGLGGLFTGAILAKEGMKVTLLEKNRTIGGGLQSFRRFGETFDTGMHIVGGMRRGGNIYKICKYLGILDQVKLKDVDDACADRLYFAEDDKYYTIAQGKDNFIESLAAYFPEERENLQRYVKAVYDIVEEVDLFNLRPAKSQFVVHSGEFMMAANDFIAKYVKNRKLRSILAYMNPLYGGRGNVTPAYVHAIINALYMNGQSRFVDGSHLFAETLADFIRQRGGEVIMNDAVAHVEVQDGLVRSVTSASGKNFCADYYVSAIHPCSLIPMIEGNAFTKAYRNRLNEIPNTYSAFSLYIKLKKDSFPYINHSEYYMTRYDDVWNFGDAEKPWPLGFLMMTPPVENQGEYSRKMLITAPMLFEKVRKWENTFSPRKDADYLAWKERCTEALLDKIEDMYPDFRCCVEAVNAASPLTIRDYYNVKDGSITGFVKDCNNITLSQLPVVTKVKNLLLTGQNNNLHGFCGVPLTAINTTEAIFGVNYIVNKINEATKG